MQNIFGNLPWLVRYPSQAVAALMGCAITTALGLDFVILDESGQPAKIGELFVVPPSIGLSTTLLNKDHHQVYFADAPRGPHGETLRRHGDQMEELPGGYWRGHGRADDTMNLGGIKVSSAELEKILESIPNFIKKTTITVTHNSSKTKKEIKVNIKNEKIN